MGLERLSSCIRPLLSTCLWLLQSSQLGENIPEGGTHLCQGAQSRKEVQTVKYIHFLIHLVVVSVPEVEKIILLKEFESSQMPTSETGWG